MCPKDNVIVCLCSLHHKIPEAAKSLFTNAFKVHQLATFDNRKKASWIFPKVFNDPTALTEELYDLRDRWASCFLDLYNPEVDYDDADEKD
ncbi:unnamed protein product [Trifolium pratense]|uniref:Uncharacterized protein n=1 Tax=Trifolium pratense TaxID=57577 RepID=A0ACB0K567_TRIPR|nr:unnamed protein product [Trifolium pratense]